MFRLPFLKKNRAISKLDTPIFIHSKERWSIRHSFEGTFIVGQSGSGKTSGSGALVAKRMLRLGYGGLVLCAKNDEADLWRKYAYETGREKQFIFFSPRDKWRFNFLEYEARRKGEGAGEAHNLTELIMHIVNSVSKSPQKENDFWEKAMRQMVSNTIDLLLLANEKITVSNIHKIIKSAPKKRDDTEDDEFSESSFCMQCIEKIGDEGHTRNMVSDYWLQEFSTLADKTRSSIVITFTASIDPLIRGTLHDLFCTELNCAPDPTGEGAVIVVDLSIKEWNDVGKIAATIWKYLFQRAIERRQINESSCPVFLWADECQYFITEYDAKFQQTARSAQCATVYLTQNLPNLYAELGSNSKYFVESLLGNLTTKFFHRNSDKETNLWGSEIIQKVLQYRHNYSSSIQTGRDERTSGSGGMSEQMDFDLQPREFLYLRNGAQENGLFWRLPEGNKRVFSPPLSISYAP